MAIEYIRNCLKRVRKRDSALVMASQNLEDFDQEGVREMTKPLFAIPPHQFLFNPGSIGKRFYMDMLQLDEAEFELIQRARRGECLYQVRHGAIPSGGESPNSQGGAIWLSWRTVMEEVAYHEHTTCSAGSCRAVQ